MSTNHFSFGSNHLSPISPDAMPAKNIDRTNLILGLSAASITGTGNEGSVIGLKDKITTGEYTPPISSTTSSSSITTSANRSISSKIDSLNAAANNKMKNTSKSRFLESMGGMFTAVTFKVVELRNLKDADIQAAGLADVRPYFKRIIQLSSSSHCKCIQHAPKNVTIAAWFKLASASNLFKNIQLNKLCEFNHDDTLFPNVSLCDDHCAKANLFPPRFPVMVVQKMLDMHAVVTSGTKCVVIQSVSCDHQMSQGFAAEFITALNCRNSVDGMPKGTLGDISVRVFKNVTSIFIYAKETVTSKVSKNDLFDGLSKAASWCLNNDPLSVLMPAIGCGLDKNRSGMTIDVLTQRLSCEFNFTTTPVIVFSDDIGELGSNCNVWEDCFIHTPAFEYSKLLEDQTQVAKLMNMLAFGKMVETKKLTAVINAVEAKQEVVKIIPSPATTRVNYMRAKDALSIGMLPLFDATYFEQQVKCKTEPKCIVISPMCGFDDMADKDAHFIRLEQLLDIEEASIAFEKSTKDFGLYLVDVIQKFFLSDNAMSKILVLPNPYMAIQLGLKIIGVVCLADGANVERVGVEAFEPSELNGKCKYVRYYTDFASIDLLQSFFSELNLATDDIDVKYHRIAKALASKCERLFDSLHDYNSVKKMIAECRDNNLFNPESWFSEKLNQTKEKIIEENRHKVELEPYKPPLRIGDNDESKTTETKTEHDQKQTSVSNNSLSTKIDVASDMRALQKAVADQNVHILRLQDDVKKLSDDNLALKKDNESLLSQITELTNEVADMRSEYNRVTEERDELRTDIAKIGAELCELRVVKDQHIRKIHELENEKAALTTENDQLRNYQTEHDEGKTKFDALLKKFDDYKINHTHDNDVHTHALELNKKLDDELVKLKAEYAAEHEAHMRALQKMIVIESEFQDLQVRYHDVQDADSGTGSDLYEKSHQLASGLNKLVSTLALKDDAFFKYNSREIKYAAGLLHLILLRDRLDLFDDDLYYIICRDLLSVHHSCVISTLHRIKDDDISCLENQNVISWQGNVVRGFDYTFSDSQQKA